MNIKKLIQKIYFKLTKKQFEIIFDRDSKLVFNYNVYDKVKKELDECLLLASLFGHQIDIQHRMIGHEECELCICIGSDSIFNAHYVLYFSIDPNDKVYDVTFRNRRANFLLSSRLKEENYASIIEVAKLQIS